MRVVILLLKVDFGPQSPYVAITHADKMHLRCQSPRATGQSQALDSWGDPLPHESQCLSIYPAEFRHLLSFGRRGVERVHLRDSDRLIDSRDSDKETENESQTPVNQTSLVSKVPRVSYFDTTIEANFATNEFGTANDTLFSNVGRIFTAVGIGRQIQLDVCFTF